MNPDAGARRATPFRIGLLVALACVAAPVPAHAAEPPVRRLAVAVSSSLRTVFPELAGAFERRNPDVRIEASYGASGTLFEQVRAGAPLDLFLGADRGFATRIREAGLARGEPFPYAIGKLAFWVSAASRVDPNRFGLASVQQPTVRRIAIADPALDPYGVAAEQALRAAGLLEPVKDRIVLAGNVLEAVQSAQGGSVQAAFVPWPMAVIPPLAAQGRFIAVPPGSYAPIEHFGVVLGAARDPKLAEEFATFVRGPAGRTILERQTFALPPG